MKKINQVVRTVVAASVLALQVSVVHAAPALQLDIAGGTYSSADQSTFASSPTFDLYALLADSSLSGQTFYISVALTPKIAEPATLGSFVFDGTTYSATSNMTFGNPPINSSINDIGPHGIYDTYYIEKAFTFSTSSKVNEYNVQTDVGDPVFNSSGTMLARTFGVDTTNLSKDVALHFDLYYYDSRGQNIDGFAPYSHDARSCFGGASGDCGEGKESRIPEPATLALLGLGLFGMVATRRRIF